MSIKKAGSALVVGAGISGIRSALDLAENGYGVTLIDKSPHLGGILSQLDYQFPTDRCGMCKMLPMINKDAGSQYCIRKGLFHENIDILLSTELTSVEGSPGNFQVTLSQDDSWINPELCVGCGDCEEKCPVDISDQFNLGLSQRKAIYLPIPHNIPNTYTIDTAACTKCGDCVEACPTSAISIPEDATPQKRIEEEVGAIILSGGTQYYDPASGKDVFNYATLPDVVTSREFERMISGSGPNKGKLLKPSDGKPVKKIAWFQCVGSRDAQTDAQFCSSVCCMHAIKEARLTKEKYGENIETTIFYMDMRAFGKSFYRYREEAETEYGVKFDKSRVHSVVADNEGRGLEVIHVSSSGERVTEIVDLIVLSVGQRPAEGTDELAQKLEIPLNQWGFCQTDSFNPTLTEKEGIVISGSYSGLKDISESVIQAQAAAAEASKVLAENGGNAPAEEAETFEYKNVSYEQPNIFVAICICEKSMEGGLDQEAIKRDLMSDPAVKDVAFIERTCVAEGWEELTTILSENEPNRVLIGACLPHVYDRKLKELGAEIKLDPAFFEVVDIRSNSWSGPIPTLRKGIAKLKRAVQSIGEATPIKRSALVVGGGIAGMTAALAIADNGYQVDLVERNNSLGGNLSWLSHTLEGNTTDTMLKNTVSRVNDHALIDVHSQSTVVESIGDVGNFVSVIRKMADEDPIQLEHGVLILATGGNEATTTSFAYDQSKSIITQKELNIQLNEDSIDFSMIESVVMVQCVDSRQDPKQYCSRICCPTMLKNALKIKELNPETAVYVFYRDIMAYGFSEIYYEQARNAGIIFIRFEADNPPQVNVDGDSISVSAIEPILNRPIEIATDLMVLATGLKPEIEAEYINNTGLRIDQDGFFQEADSKWRPVDAMKEGVFACGLALSPRSIAESVASAEAAAQRAIRVLNNETIQSDRVVARVRHSLCSVCQRCVDACPYEARLVTDDEKIEVIALRCQGCGSCAAVCPNSASIVSGFQDQQMFEEIDVVLNSFA